MPQMFPLPWLTLMTMFLILIYIAISMMYFFAFKKPYIKSFKSKLNFKNWKW